MAVAVPARMWGREEIEWQDRSWRLLENKGQVEWEEAVVKVAEEINPAMPVEGKRKEEAIK